VPQALIAVAQIAISFGGAALSAAVAIGGFFGGWIPAVLAYAAGSALLKKSAKKGRSVTSGLEVAVTDSGAQGYAIYGFVKCSGINKIPAITGGNAEGSSLEQVLELAMHEVYAFGDVHADDFVVPNKDIANDGLGTLNHSVDAKYDDMLWVRRYFGTTTQTVDATLTGRYPTIFTSDFRGRGRAYAAISYFWGDGKTFSGVPNMTFEVAGRICYDPRLDSSPGANPTDPTYMRWTHNPALQWADYLMWSRGGRVLSTKINWASVSAAAAVCDGIVPIPGTYVSFTTDGNASITGKTITKTGGVNGLWDASVRSTSSVTSGTISGRYVTLGTGSVCQVMIGFNGNPEADADFTGIDHAMFINIVGGTSEVRIYESGNDRGTFATNVTTETVVRADYDGSFVRYFINDRCVRTVAVQTPGLSMYFDSSLATTSVVAEIDVQHRYTCNIRLQLVQNWHENAKLFIDAMLGRMTYRDGQWYCYAGSWEAASYSIDKDDWLQIDRIRSVAPRDQGERYNTVRCWYVDPKRNWQREECFPRRNSTYKSSDANEEITLETEQPGCTNEYEAQRKAELLLRQSRNQIALTGALPPRFRKAATGEVVALNFEELGWVSKLHRIRSMDLNSNGAVTIAVAEEQEADWADLAASEYNAPSISQLPATNPTTPTQPQGLTIVENVNGTLTFKITPPAVIPRLTEYQIFRFVGSAYSSSNTVIYQGVVLNADVLTPNSLHYYAVRAVSNSYAGPLYPNSFGTAALPADVIWTTFVATNVWQSTIV
jgi:hypothetical protein